MWDGSIWKPYIYCLEPHMDLFSIVLHAWKNIRSTIILGNWKTLVSGGFKVMEIHQTNGCFPGIHMFPRFLDRYRKLAMAKSLVFFQRLPRIIASFASSDSSGVPRLKIRGFLWLYFGKIFGNEIWGFIMVMIIELYANTLYIYNSMVIELY